MGIRLNKVLSELNIGINTVIEFLKENHVGEIRDDAIPNTKITDDQYRALIEEFGRPKASPQVNNVLPEVVKDDQREKQQSTNHKKLTKTPSDLFGRIRRRNSPRYNKPHYEDTEVYTPERWMMVGMAMAIQENGSESLDYFAMMRGWGRSREDL